jgi:hypothetical protein
MHTELGGKVPKVPRSLHLLEKDRGTVWWNSSLDVFSSFFSEKCHILCKYGIFTENRFALYSH